MGDIHDDLIVLLTLEKLDRLWPSSDYSHTLRIVQLLNLAS